MKVFLLTLLFSITAAATDSPYSPEVYTRFVAVEARASAVESRATSLEALPANLSYSTNGIGNSRVARATYDVAVNGGTIGAHVLGVSLPAKALIKQAWFYTNTQFTDSGSGTVALHCEDAGNIFTAADITGNAAGSIVAANETGAAANMVAGIAAACEITATVAGANQSAGKITIFVEYVIHD